MVNSVTTLDQRLGRPIKGLQNLGCVRIREGQHLSQYSEVLAGNSSIVSRSPKEKK